MQYLKTCKQLAVDLCHFSLEGLLAMERITSYTIVIIISGGVSSFHGDSLLGTSFAAALVLYTKNKRVIGVMTGSMWGFPKYAPAKERRISLVQYYPRNYGAKSQIIFNPIKRATDCKTLNKVRRD